MKVIVFDLLPYGEHLEHLKVGKELPWPLPREHFKPEVAVRTYAEHLDAWEELDKLGFDGVGFNEHHTSPYGLMNSPNLLASAAAQRTKNLKLLIYGNLLPLHDPLRLAEELSMLDCMSNGRIISGFARGIPREYNVYQVPQTESRARFEEAWEIVRRAWTEEVFSFEGKFWSYKDVAIWPRPVQQPHPPVWVPVTSSKESIEWAGRNNIPITPGAGTRGLQEDVIAYYRKHLELNGHRLTPDHLVITTNAYVADSKEQALKESGPYLLYFNRTLFSHGNITESDLQQQAGYLSSASHDYVRPENLGAVARGREGYRDLTMEQLERQVETQPWGPPDEVRDRIIDAAEHAGANTVLVSLNRGAMPQEMFIEQIRRFGRDVLPALQAHQVAAGPGGVAWMLTRRELQTLTRIGPAMPMGNLLRRYWQPFAYAWELEPGGPPLRIRLMSEDLVAYREVRGRVGLVGAYCSHASAPLAYAENEGDGLRCMLHNWKFDATGRCVDLPGEVPGSQAALRSRIKGYRCEERDGIIYACLAAAEQASAWPAYPWSELPAPQKCFDDLHVRTGAWLQLLEEELGEQTNATVQTDHQPLAQELLIPNCTLREPQRDGTHEARILVPIDEDHTLSWRVRWHPNHDLTEQPPRVELAPEQRRTHFAHWWPATPLPAPSLDHLRPPEGPPPAEGDQTEDASESTLSLRSYRRLIEGARVLREQGTLPV